MDASRKRELLGDLAVVLATAMWPLVLWQQVGAGEYSWPAPRLLVLQVAATVVALVALLWRRRRPVAVALAVLPLSASAFVVVPALVALYEVAARRSRQRAVAMAAGYVAAALIGGAVTDPPEAWLWRVVTMVAFHAVPIALGWVRAARSTLLAEYADRATRAEAEQQLRTEQARQSERQRLAREMHDVVAHRISLVSLHAGGLTYQADAPPETVARAAEVIRTNAHEALEELRGVIRMLRETPATAQPERPQPTLADLPALFGRCDAAGTCLTVHDRLTDPGSVPPAVGRTVYYVLAEALTNAAKHAPRAPVDVTIRRSTSDGGGPGDNEGIALQVAHSLPLPVGNGAGADAIPGSGTGLIGLRERIELAGGRLRHGPTDDGRFVVWAEVPWSS